MGDNMIPSRSIPVEWGLSKDTYHKFLMWVSFKATNDVSGRCNGLQVTFTTREAASRFNVAPSTAYHWVSKAKSDGMLIPTGKSEPYRGKGDVYSLGGRLLETLLTVPE